MTLSALRKCAFVLPAAALALALAGCKAESSRYHRELVRLEPPA